MKLSDRVRKAIRDDTRSLRAIAREIDLDPGVLSRFMHGRSGLAIPTLERLVELLNLELVPRERKRGRRK
jgi:hypothetical protein